MTSRPVRALALLLGCGLLLPAAPPAAASGAGPGGPDRPLRYVALGDSYSAASGVLPPDPDAPAECARSLSNYPHLVAAATGARLRDVSCGGADTTDYRQPQYDGVPPQLEALGRRTRLVTMTIGGNDSGVFIDSIITCAQAGLTTAGRGSPCRDEHGSSFADTVRESTYPALVRALRAVTRRSPRAEVAILGYPWILPERVGCYPQMPVARGDVPYLRNLQRVLNHAVRRAASVTDVTFVGFARASDGHDACQLPGTRWIEPVLAGDNPVVVHPNALGEQRMAGRTMRRLDLAPDPG